MINIVKLVLLFLLFLTLSCNQNKSKEEMERLWSQANTTGEIINRSGTIFNSVTNKELALRDATTRLQSGKEGGIFGKDGYSFSKRSKEKERNQNTTTVGIPINPFLWRASLEVIDFMPLASADPFGGIIITDWYSTVSNEDERCKLNIFINGIELKTQNLKVSSYCQLYKNQKWVNTNPNTENDTVLENAILNKAKKLKLINSYLKCLQDTITKQ